MVSYLMIAPTGKEIPIEEEDKLIQYWYNEYYSFYLIAHITDIVYLAD